MRDLLETVVTGVLIGGLYGLLSAGLSLIFGITRVVNFGHGDFVTLGMYAALIGAVVFGLNPLVALPFVAVVLFVLGLVVYRVLIAPTLAQRTLRADDTHTAQIAITVAIGLVIQNALLMGFSANQRSVGASWSGLLSVGPIFVNKAQLIAFGLALVCFAALQVLLFRTRLGKAIRATVDDRDMAVMVGIPARRMYGTAFGVGIALAGIAGVILATYYPMTPTTGASFLAIAFVTVVLGGLGSVVGAFLAGIIIGMVQQLTAAYVALDLQNVGLYALFIVILLLRPQGLLGRAR